MRKLFGLSLLTIGLAFSPAFSIALGQETKPVSITTRIEINPRVFQRFDEFATWPTNEWHLLKDVADSKLEDHSLFDASLIVAGHDKKEIAELQGKLTESIRRCTSKLKADKKSQTTRSQLQAIFQHIAEEFLHGEYRADLFDVGRTIKTGEFNCLTATVLFHSFCKANALEVRVLWEPSHVQCWAPMSGASGYLIETTASSPTNAVSPLSNIASIKGRQLSPTEFVGKIFYNRGVRALNNDKYPAALISTWACCVLDADDRPAQSNLRACINNWALFSAQQANVAMVQRLFDVGMKLDPKYEPFSRNRAILLDEENEFAASVPSQ